MAFVHLKGEQNINLLNNKNIRRVVNNLVNFTDVPFFY